MMFLLLHKVQFYSVFFFYHEFKSRFNVRPNRSFLKKDISTEICSYGQFLLSLVTVMFFTVVHKTNVFRAVDNYSLNAVNRIYANGIKDLGQSFSSCVSRADRLKDYYCV